MHLTLLLALKNSREIKAKAQAEELKKKRVKEILVNHLKQEENKK